MSGSLARSFFANGIGKEKGRNCHHDESSLRERNLGGRVSSLPFPPRGNEECRCRSSASTKESVGFANHTFTMGQWVIKKGGGGGGVPLFQRRATVTKVGTKIAETLPDAPIE